MPSIARLAINAQSYSLNLVTRIGVGFPSPSSGAIQISACVFASMFVKEWSAYPPDQSVGY